MTKTPETGIVKAGSAKFGKVLLDEAVHANEEELKKRVVGTVQHKLNQIEQQRHFITQAQDTLDFFEAQIEALKTGAFTMAKSGAITFTNSKLNAEKACVVRCQSCGYEKIVIGPN